MTSVCRPRKVVTARPLARGFTMVELMAVVTIVAILAMLATISVRHYIRASKTSEAMGMFTAMKTAQESYLGDTFGYKDISGANQLADYSSFYPTPVPPVNGTKFSWGGGTSDVAKGWRELGVSSSAPVLYTYGCAAGPGSMPPAPVGFTVGNYPTAATGRPWYLLKAVADLDGDGVIGTFAASSLTAEIFSDKEGE